MSDNPFAPPPSEPDTPPPVEVTGLPDNPFEPLTPDQLNDMRLRIIHGEEPSLDEMKAVVQTMQMLRSSIKQQNTKEPKRRKSSVPKGVKVNLDDLLNGPV